MKMKNMLIGGMSLALVACLSVGATLAYFTATDHEVVNTFEFVQKDSGFDNYINVALMEKDPTADLKDVEYGAASATGDRESGYSYTDVAPGQKLPKEPQVFVHTSVPSYVYLRITTSGTNNTTLTPDILKESGWAKLDGVENVYWMAVTQDKEKELTAEASEAIVGTDELKGYMQLPALFEEVTVPNVDEEELSNATLNDVKIEVAAIQSASFTDAKVAYTDGNVKNIFTSWNEQ